jgi:hypothetical protein
MPANPDPNSGWASWLQQFLPQIGAPQPGNILNSPAAGPSAGQIQVGAPQPGNIINSPAAGPSLGRLGLPQFMGGNGVYQPPPGAPTQLPGAAPATPLGGSANPFVASAQGPMDPSIMARMAQQGQGPAGGATGSWGPPSPAAASTAAPGAGGIGSDARFPLTALGGATGSWGPPSGQGGIGSDYVAGGAPVSGAPPNTSPSGGGIGSDYVASRTAPGRPAPVASAPAGPLAPNSRFTLIDRPNAPAGGGPYGGGPPKATALDLSGMFNRGQPAAAAQPAAGGGMRPGNFPYGRSTTPGGPFMPFDITGYPVAGVNAPADATQQWLRGLFGPPGTALQRVRNDIG